MLGNIVSGRLTVLGYNRARTCCACSRRRMEGLVAFFLSSVLFFFFFFLSIHTATPPVHSPFSGETA